MVEVLRKSPPAEPRHCTKFWYRPHIPHAMYTYRSQGIFLESKQTVETSPHRYCTLPVFNTDHNLFLLQYDLFQVGFKATQYYEIDIH